VKTRRDRFLVVALVFMAGVGFVVMGVVQDELLPSIFAAAFVIGYGIFLLLSRSEEAHILSSDNLDERQRNLNHEASSIAFTIVVLVALAGAVWENTRNEFGGFSVIASVGGFSYIIATFVLRRRR
jgi:peptidoglycan/LPS O-acetylase OafA/YrhL